MRSLSSHYHYFYLFLFVLFSTPRQSQAILCWLFPNGIPIIPATFGLSCALFPCMCSETSSQHNVEHPNLHWAPNGWGVDNQLMILFEENTVVDVHAKAMSLILNDKNAEIVSEFTDSELLMGFTVANLSDETLSSILEDEQVGEIVQNRRMSELECQSDPLSWVLDRIDRPSVELDNQYCFDCTGKGVSVYVFETSGILSSHEEFDGRVSCEWADGKPNPGESACEPDSSSHGTSVASVLAGKTYGVAKQAMIKTVKFNGNSDDFVNAMIHLKWKKRQNPSAEMVINLSYTFGPKVESGTDLIIRWVDKLVEEGVVVIVAAGNQNENANTLSPQASEKAITVGMVDENDERSKIEECSGGWVTFSYFNPLTWIYEGRCWSGYKWWQSAYGTSVNIFAPGANTNCASHESTTSARTAHGTSFAAPIVAGVAAMHLQQDPTLSPEEVWGRLENSALRDILGNIPDGTPNLLVNIDDMETSNCLRKWPMILTAMSVTSGSVNWFSDGEQLPVGNYVIRYEYGCMQYSDAKGWTVHHDSDNAYWWMITVAFNIKLPPRSPVVYYPDYSSCSHAHYGLELTFSHSGGPIGFALAFTSDSGLTPIDNIPGDAGGGVNPTWSLDRVQ